MTVTQHRAAPAASRVEDMLAKRLLTITVQLSRIRGNETPKANKLRADLKEEMAEIRKKLAKRKEG